MHIEVETEDFNESISRFKQVLMRSLNLESCFLRIEYIKASKGKDFSFFVLDIYDIKTRSYAVWPNIFAKRDALTLFLKDFLSPYKVALDFIKETSDASSCHKLSTQATCRTGSG